MCFLNIFKEIAKRVLGSLSDVYLYLQYMEGTSIYCSSVSSVSLNSTRGDLIVKSKMKSPLCFNKMILVPLDVVVQQSHSCMDVFIRPEKDPDVTLINELLCDKV